MFKGNGGAGGGGGRREGVIRRTIRRITGR